MVIKHYPKIKWLRIFLPFVTLGADINLPLHGILFACIAQPLRALRFCIFNLTLWTQSYRKGRYPAFRFPCANIHSPQHCTFFAYLAQPWRSLRFCIFNKAKDATLSQWTLFSFLLSMSHISMCEYQFAPTINASLTIQSYSTLFRSFEYHE